MAFIDAHVHAWTPDTAHYPLAEGYKKEDMKPASFTPEELFKHSKLAGVDRINLIQMSFYGSDNSYMLDMMALHPEVFVGTAILDPHAEAPDQLMGELAKKKVRAFRIHPALSKQPPSKWLQPAGYEKMFAAGAKNNQAMSCLIDPAALPELDRMCKKYRETPVIIDHLCRIGVKGSIDDKDVDALCAMTKHERILVKIGAFYALGKKQAPYTDLGPLIQRVINAFGANRCMWESDCPFQVSDGHKYQDSVDLVRKKLEFLTDADREWLLWRTAEGFFFKK
jgi:predicted TIM-barrel fold metal-dependent hydrolase